MEINRFIYLIDKEIEIIKERGVVRERKRERVIMKNIDSIERGGVGCTRGKGKKV